MNKIFTPDTITVIRKKGDDFEIAQIPTRKTLRGAKLSDEQAREVTISQLKRDPSIVFILEGGENDFTAKATLAEGSELVLTYQDGQEPVGRVEVTTLKDENSSAGAFFTMRGAKDDVIFNTIDCAMNLMMKAEEYNPEVLQKADDQSTVMFTFQAREALEEAGHQVEGFLAADVDFEPFMLVHEDDIVLIGSEHFNGYGLFVEVKRLFMDVTDDERQKAAAETEVGNDIVAVHCDDNSWSFRKPLAISSKESFLEDLESAINELKQAIVHVGNEPEGEPRIELQRQLFTWEVLDAVVKYKKLPM
jgi:hypothetical protein